MNENSTNTSLDDRFGSARRRAVTTDDEELVQSKEIEPGQKLPRLMVPGDPDVRLAAWAEANRDRIIEELHEHGGVLFRGFDVSSPSEFQEVVRAVAEDLLEYKERSSPRSAVEGRVYTSTDYPADQPIFLHNENSYQHTWPAHLWFFCNVEPDEGGATPLASTRTIYRRVDPDVRGRFMEKGWMYVRNFGDGFGLDWPTVFQTEDKEEVEEHCRATGIEFEWKEGDRLRTTAVRDAAIRHPDTGEWTWFNHATFFHISSRSESVREALLAEFEEEDLPANTYYGDGSSIEPEVLDHLRGLYHEETRRFPWQEGDLLLLDNMLSAHGRDPYGGRREILVAMTDPCTWADVKS